MKFKASTDRFSSNFGAMVMLADVLDSWPILALTWYSGCESKTWTAGWPVLAETHLRRRNQPASGLLRKGKKKYEFTNAKKKMARDRLTDRVS